MVNMISMVNPCCYHPTINPLFYGLILHNLGPRPFPSPFRHHVQAIEVEDQLSLTKARREMR